LTQPFDLGAYLVAQKAPVEAALERALAWITERVPADVAEAARHGVLSDGKRLRPILCVAAHRACGGADGDAAYDLAAALELIHAYSLMHDDLPCMDDADLRRGRPTTHREHGEDVTLRAGAALIPAAALQAWNAARALGCDEDVARDTVTILLQAAGGGGMVGGQWIDLEGEGESLAAEELDDLHRRKTGALLTGSLLVGARAAGAGQKVREALLGCRIGQVHVRGAPWPGRGPAPRRSGGSHRSGRASGFRPRGTSAGRSGPVRDGTPPLIVPPAWA
jgi:geranylgeranyl pyrophosphate synthase